jgi:hypothetical protein
MDLSLARSSGVHDFSIGFYGVARYPHLIDILNGFLREELWQT